MSRVTVRPNATPDAGDAVVTPSGTIHDALNDDPADDSTYVSFGTDPAVIEFPDPTIPAGAALGAIELHWRTKASDWSGATGHFYFTLSAATAIASGTNSINGELIATGAVPQNLHVLGGVPSGAPTGLSLSVAARDGGGVALGYEAYVVVDYLEQPEVQVIAAPSGTVSDTNRPLVAWFMGLDGFGPNPIPGVTTPMSAFEVKVFDEDTYTAGDFDPDTSTPTIESGIRTDGVTTRTPVGPGSSWQSEDRLENGPTYKAYVRVAQSVWGSHFWSDWLAGSAFDIDVDLPHTPLLEVAPDNAGARNAILITEGSDGDAESHLVEIQRSTDGGLTWEQIRTKTGSGAVDLTQYD